MALRRGTAKDRIPSATDPEQGHGHKYKRRHFTGHKAAVAVEPESQLIVGATVLPGNAADATGLLEQIQQVETSTGLPVACTVGDCAYGSGATRQACGEAGRELIAKVPQEPGNRGLFPKSAFVLDLAADTVTCLEGHTVREYRATPAGGKVFRFGERCATCPFREHCTTSAQGRSVHVHPQEALLQQARRLQETPEGRRVLRSRLAVEHRLARLAQLGIGQARYFGRQKTKLQLYLAATVANLRRLWNWQQELGRRTPPSSGGGGHPDRPRGGATGGVRPRAERVRRIDFHFSSPGFRQRPDV